MAKAVRDLARPLCCLGRVAGAPPKAVAGLVAVVTDTCGMVRPYDGLTWRIEGNAEVALTRCPQLG